MELIVHGFPSKLAALQVSSDRATFGSLAGLDVVVLYRRQVRVGLAGTPI